MPQSSNKYLYPILAFAILIIFLSANGFNVITYPPRSIHQWRQSDCVAYAKTYYYKKSNFFSPSTYNLAGKNGQVVSEFPIIYYISAKLFRLFGLHYSIIRGITFLCYCLGLFYLLACIRILIKESFSSLIPVILLATSPFYYYYALNFLPNIPAISFSFVGLYYLLRYQLTGHNKYLFVATLVFIFSSLLKPTDGTLVWFAWLGIAVVHIIFKKKENAQFNIRAIPVTISSIFILGSIFGWYKFARHYNDINGNHQNLLGIYPIWNMKISDIKHPFGAILKVWLWDYQHPVILMFLLGMFILYIIKWKELNWFLKLFTLFTLIGTCLYDLLWFKAFTDHDYYQLINVIPAIFISITVLEYYQNKITAYKHKTVFNYLAIIIMALGISYNSYVQYQRYTNPKFVYINPSIYEVEPYLRKIGVHQNDIIISVPDKSPNISLSAMNNPGYTESFFEKVDVGVLRRCGASYLVINDSSYLHKPEYIAYTLPTQCVGKFNGIYIYDIRINK